MFSRLAGLSACLSSSLLLVACGGDGGDGGGSEPPATALVAIAGTAASAAAIANAPVDIKCGSGITLTGVVSTSASGTYSASVSGATLPCIVRVTDGGTVLHSVVATGTGTVTANITPVTELVTANVAGDGTTPDALYTGFDAAAQAKVTPTTVDNAVAVVTAALVGTVDLAGTNPISGTLVAANGGTAANGLGTQAATLTAALADAVIPIAALDTAVSTATSTTDPLVHGLAQQATNCAGFRSGIYRVIDPSSAVQDPDYAAHRIKLDAVALTSTDVEPGHSPGVIPLAAVSGSPCSYTFAGDFGTSTVLASPGGPLVVRSPGPNGQLRVLLVIPEQVIPLSQLAGTYDFIDYSGDDNDQPPLTSVYGTRVVGASGDFGAITVCTGTSCGASTSSAHLTVDPAGGYDLGSDGSRAFAFIADNGTVALMGFDGIGGSFDVMVRQKTLTLPADNDVSMFYDFTVGDGNFMWAPAPGASPLTDSTITVTGHDAATNSYTRVRASDGRVDTITINAPYPGLRSRTATSAAAATVYLPLPGVGLTFYSNYSDTAPDFFGISVEHP